MRISDKAELDVGVKAPGSTANATAQDAFCGGKGERCVIMRVYDQSPRGNHLGIAPKGGEVPHPDRGVNASVAPVTLGGHRACVRRHPPPPQLLSLSAISDRTRGAPLTPPLVIAPPTVATVYSAAWLCVRRGCLSLSPRRVKPRVCPMLSHARTPGLCRVARHDFARTFLRARCPLFLLFLRANHPILLQPVSEHRTGAGDGSQTDLAAPAMLSRGGGYERLGRVRSTLHTTRLILGFHHYKHYAAAPQGTKLTM